MTTFGMDDISGAELQKASLAILGLVFAHILSLDEMVEQIQRAA